jgi:hypothetical protein
MARTCLKSTLGCEEGFTPRRKALSVCNYFFSLHLGVFA